MSTYDGVKLQKIVYLHPPDVPLDQPFPRARKNAVRPVRPAVPAARQRTAPPPRHEPELALLKRETAQQQRTPDDWLALAEWAVTYLLVVASACFVLACALGFGIWVWVVSLCWWTLTGWWLRYRHRQSSGAGNGGQSAGSKQVGNV